MKFHQIVLFTSMLTSFAQAQSVMAWAPPYALKESFLGLESALDQKALDYVGLQFWNPTDSGTLQLAPVDSTGSLIKEQEVRRWVQRIRLGGAQPLLTVYNFSQTNPHWNWKLAQQAFLVHPAIFADALVKEVKKYDLAGVDLDLEGEGFLDQDREAFAQFVRKLSGILRPHGLRLHINSFHSPCKNAPNMSWWSDWLPYVDQVQSMGYLDLYGSNPHAFLTEKGSCMGGAPIFQYKWQSAWADSIGLGNKLSLGMPTWVNQWGDGVVIKHLHDALATGKSVALWDLQFQGTDWKSDTVWKTLRRVRGLK